MLSEEERRAHREGRDDVETHIAAAQASDDFGNQHQQDREGGSGPDGAAPWPEAGQLGDEAEAQAKNGNRHQRRTEEPLDRSKPNRNGRASRAEQHDIRLASWHRNSLPPEKGASPLFCSRQMSRVKPGCGSPTSAATKAPRRQRTAARSQSRTRLLPMRPCTEARATTRPTRRVQIAPNQPRSACAGSRG